MHDAAPNLPTARPGTAGDHHPPSAPPRLLIRSGVNLTAGTFRRTRNAHSRTHRTRTGPVHRSYCLCTHRTRGCTCIYQRRRVGGSAVTNVTVKLLFNYRREDFAYYAIFRSASETVAVAVGWRRQEFARNFLFCSRR